MIRLDQNFQHHSQVVATELDPAEAVLLHLDNQRYYTLNETGWFIWKSLEQKLNLKQIAEKVHQEFDVDLNKAEQCVINLLDDLQSEKLVEILSGEK